LLSFEEAVRIVLDNAGSTGTVVRPLHGCSGMALSSDVACDIDMPPFDRSAVDGFALAGAAGSWTLSGTVAAGDPWREPLEPGRAVSIMTGAPVPPGADRIVMIEHATRSGMLVECSRPPAPGENICFRAEDIRKGDRVLEAGIDLQPRHLGIAAMAGLEMLSVGRPPVVGILTTGDEVVPPGTVPGPGQVRNANMPMLEGLAASSGCSSVIAVHSSDAAGETTAAAASLIERCDIVLAAGGISMGERDCVAPSFEAAGTRFLFREVAMKPGKPLSFGLAFGKPVFGLPGNPVSVMCCFEEFVLPALRRMSGYKRFTRLRLRGRACFGHRQKQGRLNLLRVAASPGDCWNLEMPSTSGSGDLMSTSGTNALALVPARVSSVVHGEEIAFSLYHTSGPDLCWS
jgi:molybdopterin molybdotransferase